MITSHRELWKDMRKFGQNVFREFGVGRIILEQNIQDEVASFIKRLDETKEQPFDPNYAVMSAVSNVICSIVYGKRFEYSDPIFMKFLDIYSQAFQIIGSSGPLNVFPLLRFLPGDPFRYKWMVHSVMPYVEGLDKERIAEHRETRDPAIVRDIIDAFLEQMDQEKDNPKTWFVGKYFINGVLHLLSSTCVVQSFVLVIT